MMADQPFRFLDLPTEIRLMVYKFIPIVTRHHTLRTPEPEPPELEGTVTLVTKSLAGSVLASCRLVHHEAGYILVPKLERLRAEPMRLMINSTADDFCCNDQGLLALIAARAACLRSTGSPPALLSPNLSATTPTTTDDYILTSFVNRCARALTEVTPPGAPGRARDFVLTLSPDVRGLRMLLALHILRLRLGLSPSMSNIVPSCTVMRRPSDWSINAQGQHGALEVVLLSLGHQITWQDQEQWAAEWEEGESL